MLKATLFVWCLLLASSSYNAQFASQSPYYGEYNPYSQFGVYPMTDSSPYYQSFYHPMYEQDQYYGPDEDEDDEYFSPFYMREPGIGRLNGTGKIGNRPNRPNFAGRPGIGNRPNRPLGIAGRPGAGGKPNRPNRPERPSVDGRPGRPTRPIIGRPRPGAKPGASKPDADNKQKPTPFLNWLRRILLKWISFLAQLFPKLFTTVTSTQTVIEVKTCSISTTACAGRRRRAVIQQLIDHTSDEQLEKEMSSPITPENESSIAAMKLLDKREADPELYLHPFYTEDLDADDVAIEGSMLDPADEEKIKRLRKQLKMSPLKAALAAKQLGINTFIIVATTTITTTTKLTPTCSTQGTISQCP